MLYTWLKMEEEPEFHNPFFDDCNENWKEKSEPLEFACSKDTEVNTENHYKDIMEACFKAFDKDEDNNLNINEFTALLKALFRNDKGKPYPLDAYMCNELFSIFNVSGDGSMNKEEFTFCWNNWIKKIVRPVSAIIIVDVQNDFISGTLAISNCPAGQNGEEVVEPINKLLETVPFDSYCYSLDWHPSDHLSFVDNVQNRKLHESSPILDPSKAAVYDTVVFEGPPMTEQTLWPRHCEQDTWGAELHKELKVPKGSLMVYKGVHSFIESYSSFYDTDKQSRTNLHEHLIDKGVTDIFVCGLATDVCVASTAFHGLELGFRTALIDDCSRGIQSDGIKNTIEKVKNNHGVVIHSSEVKAMVQGRDRKVELGHQLALNCRKKLIYPPKNKNSRFNQIPGTDNLNMIETQTTSIDDGTKSNHNAVKASGSKVIFGQKS